MSSSTTQGRSTPLNGAATKKPLGRPPKVAAAPAPQPVPVKPVGAVKLAKGAKAGPAPAQGPPPKVLAKPAMVRFLELEIEQARSDLVLLEDRIAKLVALAEFA